MTAPALNTFGQLDTPDLRRFRAEAARLVELQRLFVEARVVAITGRQAA